MDDEEQTKGAGTNAKPPIHGGGGPTPPSSRGWQSTVRLTSPAGTPAKRPGPDDFTRPPSDRPLDTVSPARTVGGKTARLYVPNLQDSWAPDSESSPVHHEFSNDEGPDSLELEASGLAAPAPPSPAPKPAPRAPPPARPGFGTMKLATISSPAAPEMPPLEQPQAPPQIAQEAPKPEPAAPPPAPPPAPPNPAPIAAVKTAILDAASTGPPSVDKPPPSSVKQPLDVTPLPSSRPSRRSRVSHDPPSVVSDAGAGDESTALLAPLTIAVGAVFFALGMFLTFAFAKPWAQAGTQATQATSSASAASSPAAPQAHPKPAAKQVTAPPKNDVTPLPGVTIDPPATNTAPPPGPTVKPPPVNKSPDPGRRGPGNNGGRRPLPFGGGQ